jgi:hypothetical protein
MNKMPEEKKHRNPLFVKVGDELEVIESLNGYNMANGKVGVVRSTDGTGVGGSAINMTVRLNNNGGDIALYLKNDKYQYAKRDVRAIRLKEEIDKLKVDLKDMEEVYGYLVKFKDDAAEVAHKLNKAMKAKNEDEMAEVLRELRLKKYI